MEIQQLNGVFAASLTPLKPDLSVDEKKLVNHCKWLLNNGCNGLIILGTTSEANSFSLLERMKIIDCLMDAGIPKDLLMIGTGSCAITDTITLSQHVLKYGINKLLVLPPFYYKNMSDEGLYVFFDFVIQAIGDSNYHIYLYHIPPISNVPFSFNLIEQLIKNYPDTVVGMKDSSGDFEHMKAMLKTFPGFRLFAGTEKYLLDVLKLGGCGCISASVNVTSSLASEIYQNWQKKDVSSQMQRLMSIRNIIESYPVIPALKYVMAEITGDSNWQNIRPPFIKLDKRQSYQLKNELKSLNFLTDMKINN